MSYKKSVTKTIGKTEFAASQLREVISSDKLYDCIAHHTIKEIPETELKDEVYVCQRVTPREAKMNDRLMFLYEKGILDHLLAPKSDEVNYRLTPAAARAYKRQLTITDKYDHPKLTKTLIKALEMLA